MVLLMFSSMLPHHQHVYRNLNIAVDDDFGKDGNEDEEDIISGLHCKITVQFEKHRDFYNALKVLSGRSLQKVGIYLSIKDLFYNQVVWSCLANFPVITTSILPLILLAGSHKIEISILSNE